MLRPVTVYSVWWLWGGALMYCTSKQRGACVFFGVVAAN